MPTQDRGRIARRAAEAQQASQAAVLEGLRALLAAEERLLSHRLASLVARAERDPAQRALVGIVLDTIDERAELEELVTAWDSLLEGEPGEPEPSRTIEFNDLIQALLDVKRGAARRLNEATRACPDPAIRGRLDRLSQQAGEHAAILLSILGE